MLYRPYRSAVSHTYQLLLALTIAGCGGGGGDNGSENPPLPPPPPGLEIVRYDGVASNGAAFEARILNLAAHSLAWDQSRQLIYATVPSTSAIHPRTIAALDPVSEAIENTNAVQGGDPTVIRMSDDGSRLYVSVPDVGEIARFELPGLRDEPAIAFADPPVGVQGILYAADIAAKPGDPDTIAVAIADSKSTLQWISIYDGDVARVNRPSDPIRAVAWSEDGADLFGLSTYSSILIRYADDASGPELVEGVTYATLQSATSFDAIGGRLQTSLGETIDASTFQLTGWYPTPFPCLFAKPLPGDALVFALCGSDADPGGTLDVLSFDSQTFRLVARVSIPGLELGSGGFLRSHIRWGVDGLAFMTPGNEVILITGPFVTSATPETVDPPPTRTLTDAGVSEAGFGFRVREMRIGAYDVVSDRLRRRLYLSLGGASAFQTNSIAVVNPVSGRLLETLSVGSDPNTLAITPDADYLYVGIDGASSVRRIRLADRVSDATLLLGRDPRTGPYFARQIFVAPGASRTVGVARSFPLNLLTTPADGIAVFDDATQRPEIGGRVGSDEPVSYPNGPVTTYFQWGTDATTLYGINADTSSYDSSVFSVDADGLHYQRGINGPGLGQPFVQVQGLVYSADGLILHPDPMTEIGRIEFGIAAPPGESLGDMMVHYDVVSDRLFYFARSGVDATLTFWIMIVQRGATVPLDVIRFQPGFGTESTTHTPWGMASWGTDGIAVQLATGHLLLFDGEAIEP